MLEIRKLSVRYRGRSKPAVSGLSLNVNRGEFVLLAGPSASGKSTAMQAVCGFIPHMTPAECTGTILLEGVEHGSPEAIAGIACMVQQDPETQFCTETVEEEVAFGPENFRFPQAKIRDSVSHALRSVNADHLLERKLSTLSGGEKQKVAIASMLAVEPKLLILDEPTASLDPRSVGQVVGAVRAMKARSDITVVIVEHRVGDFIDMADRLLVMEEGALTRDTIKGDGEFAAAQDSAKVHPSYHRLTTREGASPVITIRDLSLDIDGWPILDEVNLNITENSVVALMGENGSGKTTLLRHMTGLQRVQRGEMTICGHRMSPDTPVDAWTIGRDVGLVFQNPNHQMFEDTVEKEILFATRNFDTSEQKGLVAVTGFEEREGLKRFVHPHCLSFGQKRRVNIVSAYSHEPRVLLLDEPFAGQDQGNVDRIVSLVGDIHTSGKTLVIVTHNEDFARQFCTDVVVLHEGRVVASGPTGSISETVWRSLRGEDRR
jgi:energy-coupling factor transporter ATP-binding protein EcfA2